MLKLMEEGKGQTKLIYDPDFLEGDGETDATPDGMFNLQREACEYFGISYSDGNSLFYGDWHRLGVLAPTEDVIAKIKNIIETGLIDNPAFDRQYRGVR
jgi:hypothetical protein